MAESPSCYGASPDISVRPPPAYDYAENTTFASCPAVVGARHKETMTPFATSLSLFHTKQLIIAVTVLKILLGLVRQKGW